MAEYAYLLSDSELARYQAMAAHALAREETLWTAAGTVPGACVVDLGCGPGTFLADLAERVGSLGRVAGVDDAEEAVRAAVKPSQVTSSSTSRSLEPSCASALPSPGSRAAASSRESTSSHGSSLAAKSSSSAPGSVARALRQCSRKTQEHRQAAIDIRFPR